MTRPTLSALLHSYHEARYALSHHKAWAFQETDRDRDGSQQRRLERARDIAQMRVRQHPDYPLYVDEQNALIQAVYTAHADKIDALHAALDAVRDAMRDLPTLTGPERSIVGDRALGELGNLRSITTFHPRHADSGPIVTPTRFEAALMALDEARDERAAA